MTKRRVILLFVLLILISVGLWWPRRWHYIVIHHSAGGYGNIEHLQKVHRVRQYRDPIDAIAYHYAIGNGNGMPDGAIGSDNRRKYHLWGVHVKNINWDKNFRGIGICMIGNLSEADMTEKQFDSLLKLTKELKDEYNIPIENVLFHGGIKGEQTECPGKRFPKEQFLKALAQE